MPAQSQRARSMTCTMTLAPLYEIASAILNMRTSRRTRQSGQSSETLADRIRRVRRIKSLTQAQLAQGVGVGPSAVAQWESKSGTRPTSENLARIALVGSVSYEWLATGRGIAQMDAAGEIPAVALDAFAHDWMEERVLEVFRSVTPKRRLWALKMLEQALTKK